VCVYEWGSVCVCLLCICASGRAWICVGVCVGVYSLGYYVRPDMCTSGVYVMCAVYVRTCGEGWVCGICVCDMFVRCVYACASDVACRHALLM